MNRLGNALAATFKVAFDASQLGKVGEVEDVGKCLLGNQPGIVDGTRVGPVARPAPEDALVGGTKPLSWFDDVEQGDGLWGFGEAIAAARTSLCSEADSRLNGFEIHFGERPGARGIPQRVHRIRAGERQRRREVHETQ